MLNPTSITFGREVDNDVDCKMIVRVEETEVEAYFNLFDENGFHRYNAQFHNVHLTNSFILVISALFEAYARTDDTVTHNGWSCVCMLDKQLQDMF